MIKLEDKVNSTAPSADYPFGKSTDNTGSNNGTPLNSATLEDYYQFFEKMFSESGITSNGLPDNNSNGWQLYDAFRKLTKPYKEYRAIITQSGTNAPERSILKNELSGTISRIRSAAGIYYIESSAAEFDFNKTSVFYSHQPSGPLSSPIFVFAGRFSNSRIEILTKRVTSNSDSTLIEDDNILTGYIEIRVYD